MRVDMERVNGLVMEINGGSTTAYTDLYLMLSGLKGFIVKSFSNKFSCFNVSESDMEEAFDIAFIKSIRSFNGEGRFYFYLKGIAERECIQVVRSAQTAKNKLMSDCISISTPSYENKDGDCVTYEDTVADKANIEDESISHITFGKVMNDAVKSLKKKDADIIRILSEVDGRTEKKEAVMKYLKCKDAAARKSIQRARERFSVALSEVGYTC